YLKVKKSFFLSMLSPLFLSRERLEALKRLPDRVVVHNLRKGIPFPDNSVDVVYHCHFLPHLDRQDALSFFSEVKRVLKPGGIQRIVVPDFEILCRQYLKNLEDCEQNVQAASEHDQTIERMIGLMVRKEPYGSSHQGPLRRFVENLLLGD